MPESQVLKKYSLFIKKREWIIFLGITLLLFSLHLAWEYHSYNSFISKPFFYTWAKILRIIPKSSLDGEYKILKLHSQDGFNFYTRTYKRDLKLDNSLRLQLFPSDKIKFLNYLKGAYIPSRIINIKKSTNIKQKLRDAINHQHTNPNISNFYRAIFLADPLNHYLRDSVNILGVAPLVALSGFHLGILWAVVLWILRLFYRPLQKTLFLWRYELKDLGSLSLLSLASYLWLTNCPPSLLRSYTMLLFAWIVVLLGVELISFSFLIIVGAILLVYDPSLLLSVSFILSMSGVFYIFLLLKYFKNLPKWILTLFIIPWGIFILMQPMTHTLFSTLSPLQFLSPIFSIIFIIFYPIEILLHIIGFGDIFDGALRWFLSLGLGGGVERVLPMWILLIYTILSIFAIYFRSIFWILFIFSGATLLWLYFG